jgi:hypothetical protein
MLLPAGAVVREFYTVAMQPPAIKTATFLGTVKRDPVSIYFYEVSLPANNHALLAVGAKLGQVYLMGATAPEDVWQREGETLRTVVKSFRLE